jgi:PAS domain S-box-containing protein
MKTRFIDKVIDRLDRIDPGSLQSHFLRLAQQKGLMETIVQVVQEGIIVLSERGIVNYANQSAEKLLGFSAEDAEGTPIGRCLPGIDWQSLLRLDEGEWSRVATREIEISYPEHRFLDFYVVPLSMADPNANGAVVILRDVTRDRLNTEQEIETERLHAITLLAAGVAHEIGNPLNSLTIHLQLLERELKDSPLEEANHFRELIGVAKEEVSRLDQIITRFLSALRPTPIEAASVRLDVVLQDTLDFMRSEIENRSINILLDFSSRLPAAQADAGQMKQAFFNIIKNAIQAMSEGGRLEIKTGSTDRFVVISFTDSGSGIDAENIGQIFEPYHSTKTDGSGLGLMIVQRIIRDHGGELEIDSEPDHGTTIKLFIPREDQRIRLLEAHSQATESL